MAWLPVKTLVGPLSFCCCLQGEACFVDAANAAGHTCAAMLLMPQLSLPLCVMHSVMASFLSAACRVRRALLTLPMLRAQPAVKACAAPAWSARARSRRPACARADGLSLFEEGMATMEERSLPSSSCPSFTTKMRLVNMGSVCEHLGAAWREQAGWATTASTNHQLSLMTLRRRRVSNGVCMTGGNRVAAAAAC